MGLRVNTNIFSLNAQRNLGKNQLLLGRSLERLSSGLRINRAADDAAGLAIAVKLLTQTRGLDQAISNAEDSINLASTAEGGIDSTTDILQRIRELAIQGANDTLTQSDRANIQVEIDQLREELTRNAETTNFNGRQLLDGSIAQSSIAVDSTAQIATNIRVGDTSATTPNITDFVSSVDSVTTTASVDVAFQLNVVASTTSGSFQVVVSNSLEGVVGTIDVGPGSAITQVSLTVGGVAFATLNIDAANVATNDIGESALVQINQARTAVTSDNGLTFQVGPNEGAFVKFGIDSLTAESLNLETISVLGTNDADSRLKAQNAIGAVDQALNFVSRTRAKIGAFQNRLQSTISNLSVSRENLTSSLSRIRDADFAAETANLTRSQILVQAGAAVLTQANVFPQNILNLL